MKRSARTATLAIALLVLACGDAGTSDEQAGQQPAAGSPRDVAGADAAPEAAASQQVSIPGSLGEVTEGEIVVATIEGGEIRLSPEAVRPGQVTLAIENRDGERCSIEVSSEHSGRWRAAPVSSGGSLMMSMLLAQADYYVFCAGGETAATRPAVRDTATLSVR